MKFRQICILLLLLSSAYLAGCSSNLANQAINSATEATPDVCEKYNGEWISYDFPNVNVEDESKIICDNKPCRKNSVGMLGFRLACQDGKITGNLFGWDIKPRIVANNETPPPIIETTRPLKDIRIEKDSLFLSYEDGYRGCLVEVNVSPKDEFLLGKFVNKDCKRPSYLREYAIKKGVDINKDYDEGSILFTRKKKNYPLD